jgi:regulator of protease activity HflC (stomatin/prohibitin superfamily)
MAWITLLVFFTMVFVILQAPAARARLPRFVPGRMGLLTIYVIGPVLSFGAFSVHVVENGHVGLVRTFGAITGQRGDGRGGIELTWPWQQIQSANVQTQAIRPDTNCYGNRFRGCMEAFTKETQDVFVAATVNFHVDPENIQPLYRTVGPDYVNKLILPRVAQVTKEEAVKYAASDIAPNRETLRKTIAQRLTTELSIRSIVIDDFLVTNIDFRDEFKAAIEAKVKAEQDAQAEQNKVLISEAQAAQRAATALGEANRLRIEAQGQADANRLVGESLTPQLIQFQAVQRLADNISIALIPSGNGIIIDPATLLATPR